MTIKSRLAATVRSALRASGYALLPTGQLEELAAKAQKAAHLGMIPEAELRRVLELFAQSHSQLNQDFFVLSELGWKREGYFVEFGATDGRSFSNTWLLEKAFGWTGILAEPARTWREPLQRSGRNARLDFDCVWSTSGETLTFHEAVWAELSTLSAFKAGDDHQRSKAAAYPVRTISLNDMLERHGAPREMDYLSIDTEGSEYAILEAFDFARYSFRCITCEHNHTPNRERIHDLLTAHGYRRKHAEHSQFDDWYVR